ncbi:MAG: hypothetical protein C4562_00190 [Actinobacteria bacterium]|nr:MAG: hypothetical protein C4562_00190 [Actinomycetota bacterium]
MRRTIIFFILINIILSIALFAFPLKAIDISQLKGLPPWKHRIRDGKYIILSNKKKITQTFIPKADNICGVALFFTSRASRTLKGKVFLTLKQDGQAIAIKSINSVSIKNRINYFYWPAKRIKRKPLSLEVNSNAEGSNCVFLWASLKNVYKNGLVYQNSQKRGIDLVFQTYYQASLLKMLTGKIGPKQPLIKFIYTIPLFELLFFAIALVLNNILAIKFG